MDIQIRPENPQDYNHIYNLLKEAFKSAPHADGDEQNLVNRLRKSSNYLPQLSLVAEIDNQLVGYIMYTELSIQNDNRTFASLALAPLAVAPSYQNTGIGSKLITESLQIAKALGYHSAIVLGSETYYPKFGFKEASTFHIEAPFEVPSQNFMAIELIEKGLECVSGKVIYAKEFFEQN